MSDYTDPDVCDCECHIMGVLHSFPCCAPCPVCKKNIKNGRREWAHHEERHAIDATRAKETK